MKRFLLIFLCTILVGCGHEEYAEVVTEKRFVPSYSWVQMSPCGKAVIPIVHNVPAEYILVTESHRKIVTSRFYNSATIGDTLFVTKDSLYLRHANH